MRHNALSRFAAALAWMLMLALAAQAQPRRVRPGFNLFSVEQDIQIGKEYSAQIEKELVLVQDRELNDYIQRIGNRLIRGEGAGNYPYTFKVVQDDAINAFALPGGPTYINTGLILAADNEAMLAGVMGHEIAHVALRHGTNQVSRANLIQIPAMLAGQMAGGGITGMLAQLGVGLGANSLLLKYSRNAERDADILGARLMHQAGYNPIEAARFFEKLEAQTGKRSGIENFLSSHPTHGSRMREIEQEIQYLPQKNYDASEGDLNRIKGIIQRLPQAPKPKPPGQGSQGAPQGAGPSGPVPPSGSYREFTASFAAFAYPDNWEVIGGDQRAEVTIAPRQAIVRDSRGQAQVTQGVIASVYRPQRGANLRDATQELIRHLQSSNPSMQVSRGGSRSIRVDGRPALMTTLTSESALGGREIDTLVTAGHPSGLYYMVFIAPENQFDAHKSAFEQMLQSVRLPK